MAVSASKEEPAVAGVSIRRKAVLAGGIGHALEVFDVTIYGYLATVIATLFFPPGNPSAALIFTFMGFAVAYLMRPVGALFFGPLGDKAGRRVALVVAITMMSVGTFIIGVLPTYAQIGLAAPILLFVARLVQGFATGGEFSGSSSFIVEYAPDARRGFYGSWQQFSTVAGSLLGTGIGAIVTTVLSEQALNSWGWRVPFLMAL